MKERVERSRVGKKIGKGEEERSGKRGKGEKGNKEGEEKEE